MAITDEVLNEILKDYQKPEDLLGQNGLLKQLQKRLLEKAMGAELTVHLGYGKHDPAGRNSGNSRNGTSPKTLKGEIGNLELATPRDRNGSFEPQIVAKGQRRFEGFDQAIISLYTRGLTTRAIEGHLLEIYGVEVSPALVSQVTDAVDRKSTRLNSSHANISYAVFCLQQKKRSEECRHLNGSLVVVCVHRK